jgi:chemotaxis protein histidine kinase CheA
MRSSRASRFFGSSKGSTTAPSNTWSKLGTLVGQLSRALYEDTTRLEMITDGLEEGIRTLRLLPLSTIFNLYPRLVRDLARQENKQVDLVIEGWRNPRRQAHPGGDEGSAAAYHSQCH